MDIQEEIEKLEAKKIELINRINLSEDEVEKDELRKEVERIEKQIEMLKRFV